MKTPSKKNKRTEDKEGETNGGDSYMSESNVVDDLPLDKSNDDQHLVKNGKSEDGEQGKKEKKKRSEESKHKEYNEFKSNDCEDDNQGKKIKKKRKKMLVEGNTPEECNDHFRSNVDEDGKLDKKVKKKKKKLSEESKLKEFESNECEDDNQGKKMKKKQKLIEGNTLKECNDFRSNGDEDGKQDKKMKKKKKKLSEKSNHKEYTEFESNECEDDQGKKMKKKRKLIEGNTLNECNDFRNNRGEDGEQDKKMKKKKKKLSEESKHKEYSEFKSNESKPKRVTFSDEVETFSCDGLVRGKRFTPEEDEKLKASVFDYIDSHGLGEEGLDKVLHSRSHPEVHGCWKEIARVLPHRSRRSVYDRGHVLLEHIGRCKWTPDELEFIRKSYEQHGPNYRLIADALGKSRDQVKDAWRRLKFEKARIGRWSQEEYQTLFNLVNLDLRSRSLEPYRKTKHDMLRDNICWRQLVTNWKPETVHFAAKSGMRS
ncbi:unnamed protein product [Trifolium pratense]|uniref:Uncharacterized protein n=1 Tax=Trifolium pratense TaxID=57577 RepID=A0ACB0M7D5_TRIPR|nr:unnamed protein product [Trifolium pratense]